MAMLGWHGPPARPAGLPARLSGAGRSAGNGVRLQAGNLTRSVRRVAGRYRPVARATLFSLRKDRVQMPPRARPAYFFMARKS